MKPKLLLFVLLLLPWLSKAAFQPMHIPGGTYQISRAGSYLPANCVDADKLPPTPSDFFLNSTDGLIVKRERNGQFEECPFSEAENWITVKGATSDNKVFVEPKHPDDGFSYILEVRPGGAVVGENSDALSSINPLIIDGELIVPLDQLDQKLRDANIPELYDVFRDRRKEYVDRIQSRNALEIKREIDNLVSRYETILSIKEIFDPTSLLSTYLIDCSLSYYEPTLADALGLDLTENTYHLVSDYLSLFNGSPLTTKQATLIEGMFNIKLPPPSGLFEKVKLLDLENKAIWTTKQKQNFLSTDELIGSLSNSDVIVTKEGYIPEAIATGIKKGKIIAAYTIEYLANGENFIPKKCHVLFHYSSDKKVNSKIWNNQDNQAIDGIVSKAVKQGVLTFENEAELAEITKGYSTKDQVVIITDNNPNNNSLIISCIYNRYTILACKTYKQQLLEFNTLTNLDLESTAKSAPQFVDIEISNFEMTRRFVPTYFSNNMKKAASIISKAALIIGSSMGAAYILHAVFSFEFDLNAIKTKA
eukprot:Unigene3685_Nuclearia_a/m.11238 Unigene3685_Nuclearia_a/g.11238  ORF Unigene3685_Nuclearia_a/g.11238 Unigene3685_Nuclearia_a/m.11238 type:complete len:534 (+) Unigene3685_Nuclearia_a:199-1800(+)